MVDLFGLLSSYPYAINQKWEEVQLDTWWESYMDLCAWAEMNSIRMKYMHLYVTGVSYWNTVIWMRVTFAWRATTNRQWSNILGVTLINGCRLNRITILCIVKIRRSYDHLILYIGNPYTCIDCLCIEDGHWYEPEFICQILVSTADWNGPNA